MTRHFISGVLAACFLCGSLLAQDASGEGMPRFESLLADPQMTAMGGRVLWVGHTDTALEDDLQAEAILGENLPIVALARGTRPVSLGLGASVIARFGLITTEYPLVASDWSLQVNVNHRRGPWTLVAAVWHESGHLGDEYIELFGAEESERAREGVTLWAFHQAGSWRVGASVSGAFRIVGPPGRFGVSGGADFQPPRRGRGLVPRAGVFLGAEAQSDWRPTISARVGAALPIATGNDVTISLAGYSGPSTFLYFLANDLRYVGLEFRFDL